MSTDGIQQFLSDLGLEKYIPEFESNDISVEMLAELTDDEFKELGVQSMGHRKVIRVAAQEVRAEPAPGPTVDTGSAQPAAGTVSSDTDDLELPPPQHEVAYNQDVIDEYAEVDPTIVGLAAYLELNGEQQLGVAGPQVLTNFRLLMFVDHQGFSIPLCDLKEYDASEGPLKLVWEDDGELRELSITGTILKQSYVLSALHAAEWQSRWSAAERAQAMALVTVSRDQLVALCPDIDLPEPPEPRGIGSFPAWSCSALVTGIIAVAMLICLIQIDFFSCPGWGPLCEGSSNSFWETVKAASPKDVGQVKKKVDAAYAGWCTCAQEAAKEAKHNARRGREKRIRCATAFIPDPAQRRRWSESANLSDAEEREVFRYGQAVQDRTFAKCTGT